MDKMTSILSEDLIKIKHNNVYHIKMCRADYIKPKGT